MSKLYVLSLGGSLIVPGDIDQKFLSKFRSLILRQIKRGRRFVIVAGGGQTSRKYQAALKVSGKPNSDDLDWMGIEATRINAELVRLMFGKLANPNIVRDPNKKVKFSEKILVAGGWKPGRSSDDDAVRLAKVYGSKTVINLSNIDYVFTKDPRKFKNAQAIENITWNAFNKMFGQKWNPGAHVPFDPVAARFAKANGQTVIIANGKNLKNISAILDGGKFKGTKIS